MTHNPSLRVFLYFIKFGVILVDCKLLYASLIQFHFSLDKTKSRQICFSQETLHRSWISWVPRMKSCTFVAKSSSQRRLHSVLALRNQSVSFYMWQKQRQLETAFKKSQKKRLWARKQWLSRFIKEIGADAAVVAVLSELNGTFALKEKQRTALKVFFFFCGGKKMCSLDSRVALTRV